LSGSERQQLLLEAAAAALQLVEAGDVTARGTLGPLRQPNGGAG
jgi:hypothetical protein